jgi:hypothetical protein
MPQRQNGSGGIATHVLIPGDRFRRLGGHPRKSVCCEEEFSGLFEGTLLEFARRGCGKNLRENLDLRERK